MAAAAAVTPATTVHQLACSVAWLLLSDASRHTQGSAKQLLTIHYNCVALLAHARRQQQQQLPLPPEPKHCSGMPAR
jgi:hypothetical protein